MVKGHLPHPSPKTSGLFPVICSIYASHDMLPAPGSFANLAPQSFGPRTAAASRPSDAARRAAPCVGLHVPGAPEPQRPEPRPPAQLARFVRVSKSRGSAKAEEERTGRVPMLRVSMLQKYSHVTSCDTELEK